MVRRERRCLSPNAALSTRFCNAVKLIFLEFGLPSYDSVLALLYIAGTGRALQDDDQGTLEELDPDEFTFQAKTLAALRLK
jgi:hypothetical protein